MLEVSVERFQTIDKIKHYSFYLMAVISLKILPKFFFQ